MKQLDMFRKHGIIYIQAAPGISPPKSGRVQSLPKPGRVIKSPQATSLAAYRSLERYKIARLKEAILQNLHDCGPATDDVLERVLAGFKPSSIRTRRSELVKLGKVRDSGKREKLPSGRMAIVWCLADGK